MNREQRQLRTAATEFQTREDGEELIIEGYFAVFNSNYDLGMGMSESIEIWDRNLQSVALLMFLPKR